MALPVTITGISSAAGGVQCVGPFKSSGGNYYFFGVDGTTATTLQAYKATDPSSSWASIATKTGFTTAITYLSGFRVGDVIHLTVCDGTLASSLNQKYQTFNMASDAFVTAETIASALATAGQLGAGQPYASIVVRSGGEAVVFFNGAQTKTSGTNRARVYYSRRTGTNTWSAATQVDANAAYDTQWPEAVLGASDRVHFFFVRSSNSTTHHRALSSANALQTDTEISGPTGAGAPLGGVSYSRSGATKVIQVGSIDGTNYRFQYFDSADSPTINTVSTIASAGSRRPYVDGTDAWFHYVFDANTLKASKSTDDGATWGSSVTTMSGGTNFASSFGLWSIDGEIYQRGSNVVIPFLINDNGTLKYNEYTVRTVSTPSLPIFKPPRKIFTRRLGP